VHGAVYDPGTASGRLLALDLDPGRPGDVDHQAAALGQLLERLGARYVADVSPSGGRHIFVLFAASLPRRELRDVARALSQRLPAVDPAPMSSVGGKISPPGARHKTGGWRTLTMPMGEARAAVERPNGPEVWAALLTEFAAELQYQGGDQVLRQHADGQPVAELDDARRAVGAPPRRPRTARSRARAGCPLRTVGPIPATQAAARPGWPS
jgi:DNA primase